MSTVTRGRIEYPARASEFARRLAENGLSVVEIRDALARYGFHPTLTTIRYWCDPDRKLARNLRRRSRLGRSQAEPAWWAKRRRMRELRDLGVSFDAIRRIINHDLELELTTEQVRGILNGTYKNVRGLLGG